MKNFLPLGCLLLSLAGVPGAVASPNVSLAAAAGAKTAPLAGIVVETMNAASYTYVLIDTGAKKEWAAAPQFAVKVGDKVLVADAMPMAKYQSKTLNRTFDVVYFSGSITVNGAAAAPPAGPASATRPPAATTLDFTGIARAPNGQTVAEIITGKTNYAGKPIAVRGRVVKFNAMIMGKNWLHLRDGSGAEGTNDLTVTTATAVKVGDRVLVTGVLSVDRDFGAGYKYGVIVENATVVVE